MAIFVIAGAPDASIAVHNPGCHLDTWSHAEAVKFSIKSTDASPRLSIADAALSVISPRNESDCGDNKNSIILPMNRREPSTGALLESKNGSVGPPPKAASATPVVVMKLAQSARIFPFTFESQ